MMTRGGRGATDRPEARGRHRQHVEEEDVGRMLVAGGLYHQVERAEDALQDVVLHRPQQAQLSLGGGRRQVRLAGLDGAGVGGAGGLGALSRGGLSRGALSRGALSRGAVSGGRR